MDIGKYSLCYGNLYKLGKQYRNELNFMQCDYCESYGDCYPDCECSKCIDPEGYEDWKENSPEEYEAWVEKKLREEDEEY